MRYASVCSGIEAASVAWTPLGWEAAFFAEIEKFPSAVLAHHYPDVPNYGDITKFKDWPDAAFDVLVGGTPCQSFSVAGLRKGLDDPRGNLALVYLAIADRYRPRWLVWENVPGVLSSSGGRDFGAFLGGLAELGYGWAYRVLDAQFVRTRSHPRAVPQRRRRVFVVGYLGDWRRAAAVLFKPESMSGHPPPRRTAGEGASYDIAPCIGASGRGFERTGDTRGQDCLIANAITGDSRHAFPEQGRGNLVVASTGDISHCPNAGGMRRIDYESETLVSHSLRGEGFDASADGTGRGTPLVPVKELGIKDNNIMGLSSKGAPKELGSHAIAIQGAAARENPASGPDGVGVRSDGAAYTLEARQEVQAVAYDMRGREGGARFEGPHDTANIRAASGGSSGSYLAFAQNQRDEIREMEVAGALAAQPGMKQQTYVSQDWAVRRLAPGECEKLQGFPPGYTAVPYRGKPAADGPRYKALGNSMAVNCMSWLGERIAMREALTARRAA
ncbi:MAG: DNA cytosine methyltransferase [Nitrospira sp.]|nr:DNA cytosine methyltransferase [Nitrospira sp.]